MATLIRKTDACIIRLEGRLIDGDARDKFRARFSEALISGAREFVIDMSGASMFDCSDTRSTRALPGDLHALDGFMMIAGVNGTLCVALKLTRLEQAFEFVPMKRVRWQRCGPHAAELLAERMRSM